MRGRICGTGSYLPEKYYDNNDIAKIVETSDAWIRERTGIVRRHIASGDETTVSMAVEAGRRALENGHVLPEEIDMILVSTITPNALIPGVAFQVQAALGADRAVCFDLSAACSGFVFAYQTAQAYIAAGLYQTILLIGSETLSAINNWEDRSSCILFGDGAGAAVVRAEEGELYPSVAGSDGTMGHVLACESRVQNDWQQKEADRKTYIDMDGTAVFKFAVRKMPEMAKSLMTQLHYTEADIDWFITHQANERIIEAIARRLKSDIAKFPMNIAECGNTSSASIPILLDEMNRSGQLKDGQKIIMAGFGAGLSWGAVYMEWHA